MGDRYGRSIWEIGHHWDNDRVIHMVIYHIDMVILDIDMGDLANDMGVDSIDTVISHIDMGYLVTLEGTSEHFYTVSYYEQAVRLS